MRTLEEREMAARLRILKNHARKNREQRDKMAKASTAAEYYRLSGSARRVKLPEPPPGLIPMRPQFVPSPPIGLARRPVEAQLTSPDIAQTVSHG